MKRNRILVGAFTTVILVAVLACDYYFLPWLPSAALLSVVAYAASYELCKALEAAGLSTYPKLTSFASFVVALTPAAMGRYAPDVSSFAPQAGLIFLFVVMTFAIALKAGDMEAGVKAVVGGTFVLVYVGFALSFLVRLRGLEDVGWTLLIFALACAKTGDMGAYFVGKSIGRHPLARNVSPKKTVEGALGALAVSILVAFATSPFLAGKVSLAILIVWALVLSVAAQFGDLAESLLKRAGGVKDSSSFFGHMGGTLDVVDSLLLCAPTAFILAVVAGFKIK